MKKQRHPLTGFTVLEVVLALFIVSVGAIGVFSLTLRTFSSAGSTNNKLVASYLAQEGIEIVRNIRDTNFLEIRKDTPGVSWDDQIIDPDGDFVNECATSCQADYNDTVLTGVSGSPNALLRDPATNIYGYDSGAPTIYTRMITATTDADKIYVQAKVAWQEGGQPREVVAATELFNWLTPD